MPHFPPNQFPYFNGPNFSVSNDRVLDHLRVRQANTFKVPPATKILINPNHEDVDGLAVWGDNNPVTNETLRSGVAQAGALVYSTTPILNSAAPGVAVDGCFDGRNHLYFSDGDQWIPLANCLPLPSGGQTTQRGERFMNANGVVTPLTSTEYFTVQGDRDSEPSSNKGFEGGGGDGTTDYWLEYTGEPGIVARVSLSVSVNVPENDIGDNSDGFNIGVFKESLGIDTLQDNLLASAFLEEETTDPAVLFRRNVSLNGFVSLAKGDKLRVKIQDPDYAGTTSQVLVSYMNLNVDKITVA